MTTPTFIMAVPWWPERTKNAVSLMRETDATIVWDENRSIMDTWRKAMSAAGSGPGIFLEDDVVLTNNWREKVEAEIAEYRTSVIQFFTLGQRVRSKHVSGHLFMMTVCYYLPPGAAASLLVFAEGWEDKYDHINMKMGCDRTIGEWLRSRDETYWHSVPSLVQHRPWESMVDSKRLPNRIAENFQ